MIRKGSGAVPPNNFAIPPDLGAAIMRDVAQGKQQDQSLAGQILVLANAAQLTDQRMGILANQIQLLAKVLERSMAPKKWESAMKAAVEELAPKADVETVEVKRLTDRLDEQESVIIQMAKQVRDMHESLALYRGALSSGNQPADPTISGQAQSWSPQELPQENDGMDWGGKPAPEPVKAE